MPANFEPVITTTIPSIRSVMLTNNNSNCSSSMRHSSTYSRSASTSNMNKKKDKTKGMLSLFNNFTSCNPYYRKYPPFVDYGCYNRWSGLRSTALWVSYKPIPRIR